MYIVLYIPENNDPEVFGPYTSAAKAAAAMRHVSFAAGTSIDIAHAGPLATVDIKIENERNRYQLLKIGSPDQLTIHADIISELTQEGKVTVDTPTPLHLTQGAGLLGG